MTPPPPKSAGPTVAELDEQDLIARITTQLPVAPDWLLVGPGRAQLENAAAKRAAAGIPIAGC